MPRFPRLMMASLLFAILALFALLHQATSSTRRRNPRYDDNSNKNNQEDYRTCVDPCVPGTEEIMKKKSHGTSTIPVQSNLLWKCDEELADRICNFNRQYAEHAGYWEETDFLSSVSSETPSVNDPITFYDSNTGQAVFTAPVGRTWQDFVQESRQHGWPSFRDQEVHWDRVRVLSDGETVSTAGTHLGHNLPDGSGRRYCINLVSIAGRPAEEEEEEEGEKEDLR